MKQYPYVSGRSNERKGKKCFICNELTKQRVIIQVNIMRGDDDVVACCSTHHIADINIRIGVIK